MDADSALAEGAEIRIMSFNLLCELWNDKPPIEGRDTRAMAIFTYYAPDVVGIQEVSDKWYSALDNCFGGLYAFTDRKTERNATNFSTLIYNTEKVKLLDHGTQVFSKGNDPRLRLVTYGVFEKLDSGKRFIVVTTHWDLGSNPQYQQVHSDEMADICLSLGKKYNLPVITTGDYNSKESSSYITNFLAKTGYIDSKYTAAEVKHDCKTYPDLGVHVSTAKAECIDHIFASPDVEFLFYNVEVSDVATDTSDHNPIYADLRLK
ncbi:MAG: endonuclease/exonuclease/phosphatase family protein [Clostridia bacterium]|nr:endonuclease/exonuclease/phosphatase family protein [Clostridia bacterium]